MKKVTFLLILMLPLTSCQIEPYIPPVTSAMQIYNETGFKLCFRVYKVEGEDLPPFKECNYQTSYIRLDLETDYIIDAYLISPEKEIIIDSLIYTVREIFGESSFLFNSGQAVFDLYVLYEDGHIEFEINTK